MTATTDKKPRDDEMRDGSSKNESSAKKGGSSYPNLQKSRQDQNLEPNEIIGTHEKPTKVGKAHPIRDLLLFVGLIIILSIFSLRIVKDVGQPDQNNSIKKKADRIKKSLEERMKADLRMQEIKERGRDDTLCGVYLASSTIPGGGMGLFAGRTYYKDDILIDSGLAFPVVSFDRIESGTLTPERQSHGVFLSQYGMLMNHHPRLVNIEGGHVRCNDDFVETCTKFVTGRPSRLTVQHSSPFKATRTISPGEELFLSFENHPHGLLGGDGKLFNYIPLKEDYAIADEIVMDLKNIPQKKSIMYKKRSSKVDESILLLVKKSVMRVNKKVGQLLPDIDIHLRFRSNVGSTYGSLLNRTIYSIEKHGFCMDNVQVGRSTIRGAGKGVFAKRLIKKGELVIPAPLYITHFEGSESGDIDGMEEESTGPIAGSSLINYCFGHNKTSLLLCPQSFAAFINHGRKPPDSSEGECKNNPNADYRWSDWNQKNNKAISVPVDEVLKTYPIGLSFDIVAMRDIQAGEEILIDYGTSWEAAWNEYDRTNDKLYAFSHPIEINVNMLPLLWKNRS